MTSPISPAAAGLTSLSTFPLSTRKQAATPASGLNEMESVLAGIVGSDSGAQGPAGLGSASATGDLFELASGRTTAGLDVAAMLAGAASGEAALTPDAQFAQVREAMIGTILDLKK